MRELTITCDRCKAVITDHSQVWHFNGPHFGAEWCISCVIEMGLFETKEKMVNQRIEPKLTIEDFIHEEVGSQDMV